jgi:seryl-tRNA synthetase
MLDPKILRSDAEQLASKLKRRGYALAIDEIQSLEEKRKIAQEIRQDLQHQRNTHSKAIGQAVANGQDVASLKEKVVALGEQLKAAEEETSQLEVALHEIYAMIPNVPHDSVPDGESENENVEIRREGELPSFNFQPKDHVDLGEINGQLDFDTAAKLSGARFVVMRNGLARLHRALIQFMLSIHTKEHGYEELYVPYLVNSHCLYGTGQLPKMQDDIFTMEGGGLSLVPTAEVPVTNTLRESIVEETALPLKFVCHTPCFRREAGSYGKDTKGIIRQHQFEKVELVQVVKPEDSYEALEQLRSDAETILKYLELPYRVLSLCAGDLGFSAAKTYDLEVWLPSQQRYREISSCSNTEDFQARRMQARFRRKGAKKPELLHTINGSGLAVGRTLVALMENYQDEAGNIHVPAVLYPFTEGMTVIKAM